MEVIIWIYIKTQSWPLIRIQHLVHFDLFWSYFGPIWSTSVQFSLFIPRWSIWLNSVQLTVDLSILITNQHLVQFYPTHGGFVNINYRSVLVTPSRYKNHQVSPLVLPSMLYFSPIHFYVINCQKPKTIGRKYYVIDQTKNKRKKKSWNFSKPNVYIHPLTSCNGKTEDFTFEKKKKKSE